MSDDTPRLMAEFVRWAMEAAWDGGSLDGGELQDKAELLGLIVRAGARNDWFIFSEGVKAALKGNSLTTALPNETKTL